MAGSGYENIGPNFVQSFVAAKQLGLAQKREENDQNWRTWQQKQAEQAAKIDEQERFNAEIRALPVWGRGPIVQEYGKRTGGKQVLDMNLLQQTIADVIPGLLKEQEAKALIPEQIKMWSELGNKDEFARFGITDPTQPGMFAATGKAMQPTPGQSYTQDVTTNLPQGHTSPFLPTAPTAPQQAPASPFALTPGYTSIVPTELTAPTPPPFVPQTKTETWQMPERPGLVPKSLDQMREERYQKDLANRELNTAIRIGEQRGRGVISDAMAEALWEQKYPGRPYPPEIYGLGETAISDIAYKGARTADIGADNTRADKALALAVDNAKNANDYRRLSRQDRLNHWNDTNSQSAARLAFDKDKFEWSKTHPSGAAASADLPRKIGQEDVDTLRMFGFTDTTLSSRPGEALALYGKLVREGKIELGGSVTTNGIRTALPPVVSQAAENAIERFCKESEGGGTAAKAGGRNYGLTPGQISTLDANLSEDKRNSKSGTVTAPLVRKWLSQQGVPKALIEPATKDFMKRYFWSR